VIVSQHAAKRRSPTHPSLAEPLNVCNQSIRTLQNADKKHRRINGLLQSLHLVFDSKLSDFANSYWSWSFSVDFSRHCAPNHRNINHARIKKGA
jgi:hypothetical protein